MQLLPNHNATNWIYLVVFAVIIIEEINIWRRQDDVNANMGVGDKIK